MKLILGYPYHNMNYLARFRFDPTTATADSSQLGDLFLPPSTHAVNSPPPDSPNSAPQFKYTIETQLWEFGRGQVEIPTFL